MTYKYNLFRKAQGTSPSFHLDGKMIECRTQDLGGLGACYVYSTNDAREASRLQIVHGFKINVRAILPPVDRAQIKELGEKLEEAPKPKRRTRRSRAKKSDET